MIVKILDSNYPLGYRKIENVYLFNITTSKQQEKIVTCGYTNNKFPNGKVEKLKLETLEVLSPQEAISGLLWKKGGNNG